jgi:hypothetical protein
MVATDHDGACIGTQHLIELGHWRIACVSGPLDWRCGLFRDPQSPAEHLIIKPELVRRESAGKKTSPHGRRVM